MGPLLQQLITVWIICIANLILSAGPHNPKTESSYDDVVYACKDNAAQIRWNHSNDYQVENVKYLQLLFEATFNTTHLVASKSHDQFLPAKQYSGRVSQVQQSGLTLDKVTKSDEGNYTLEIIVSDNNASVGLVFYKLSVYVQVSDDLMVKGGRLKASQDPAILLNMTTRRATIRLLCGDFTFKGKPPIQVQWLMPNGEIQVSTGYEGGQFYLLDPQPVGNFTCSIPDHFYPQVCYDDSLDSVWPPVTEDAIFVDEGNVRLAVLHAEMSELLKDKERLHDNVTSPDINMVLGPCTTMNYTQINDINWLRSVTNYVNTPYNNVCDNLLVKGWYRWFINGQDAIIPTACPSKQVCSSVAPMWIDLQGQRLPVLLGQMIKARACAHYNGDCCHWKIPSIFVRNCGSFFLYHLAPSPICSLAYCLKRKVLPID